MAIRRYALKLNENSLQTGDISLKQLVDYGYPVLSGWVLWTARQAERWILSPARMAT